MIDFNNIQKYRENNRIEAKLALGGLPQSIWETYSAFANTMGGVILLGVEERADKSLHPVNLPDPHKLIDEFWQLVSEKKKVSANVLSMRNIYIQTIDQKSIVVIEVPRAGRFDRPVYIDKDPYGGSYRRNGEGDYRCHPDEVEAMLRDAAVLTQDHKVIESMSVDCIDIESVKRFRAEVGICRPNYVPKDIDRVSFLERLGAVQSGMPTVSGLLMFGKYEYIKSWFKGFSLKYTDSQCSFSSDDGDWSGNLYDFYRKIKNSLQVKNAKYPLMVKYAILEAISNGITNGDYYVDGGISVFVGQKAVVISNPGGFRTNFSSAKSGGVSDPRNYNIIKMFSLIDAGTRMGSGIPELLSVWRKEGWKEPWITEKYNPMRVTVYLPMVSSKEFTDSAKAREAVLAASTASSLCCKDKKEAEIKSAYRKLLIIEYLTYSVVAGVEELASQLFIPSEELEQLLVSLVSDDIVVCTQSEGNKLFKLKA